MEQKWSGTEMPQASTELGWPNWGLGKINLGAGGGHETEQKMEKMGRLGSYPHCVSVSYLLFEGYNPE